MTTAMSYTHLSRWFQGYVPRSCDNGLLPPLDPFVEVDTEDDPASKPPPINGGSVSEDQSPAEVEPSLAHPCPRCARRFAQWAELEDHKTKCLQY